MLKRPFAKVPGRSNSIDAFDYDSATYIGLRMIDHVVDFETGERDEALGAKAESVGELLGA